MGGVIVKANDDSSYNIRWEKKYKNNENFPSDRVRHRKQTMVSESKITTSQKVNEKPTAKSAPKKSVTEEVKVSPVMKQLMEQTVTPESPATVNKGPKCATCNVNDTKAVPVYEYTYMDPDEHLKCSTGRYYCPVHMPGSTSYNKYAVATTETIQSDDYHL